jgi:hypothetical protein
MDAGNGEHHADDLLEFWFPADNFWVSPETFGK